MLKSEAAKENLFKKTPIITTNPLAETYKTMFKAKRHTKTETSTDEEAETTI